MRELLRKGLRMSVRSLPFQGKLFFLLHPPSKDQKAIFPVHKASLYIFQGEREEHFLTEKKGKTRSRFVDLCPLLSTAAAAPGCRLCAIFGDTKINTSSALKICESASSCAGRDIWEDKSVILLFPFLLLLTPLTIARFFGASRIKLQLPFLRLYRVCKKMVQRSFAVLKYCSTFVFVLQKRRECNGANVFEYF